MSKGEEKPTALIMPIAFVGVFIWMNITLGTIKGVARNRSVVIFITFFFQVVFWMAFESPASTWRAIGNHGANTTRHAQVHDGCGVEGLYADRELRTSDYRGRARGCPSLCAVAETPIRRKLRQILAAARSLPDARLVEGEQVVDPHDGPAIKEELWLDILQERMKQAMLERTDKSVFVRADGAVSYQDLVFVMDKLKEGGVEKVGLATRPGTALMDAVTEVLIDRSREAEKHQPHGPGVARRACGADRGSWSCCRPAGDRRCTTIEW